MYTVEELTDEINDIIKDGSYTDSDILSYLNKGLKLIASRLYLPALETSDEIDTDSTNAVSLPDDYHRNLYYCYSVDHNSEVEIYPSETALLRKFYQKNQEGRVVGVALRGKTLFYQRIPGTAETLKIYYFKLPTELEDSADTPDCLFEGLEADLLVNFVCYRLFTRIYEVDSDFNSLVEFYKNEFDTAMSALSVEIGPYSVNRHRVPVTISKDLNWDAYL